MSSLLPAATGLTAAGTTQATALVLNANYPISQVSTVAASSGVKLPATTPGSPMWIINQGLNPLAVYPPTGGAINGGTVNVAYSLYPGASAMFCSGDSLAWQAYSGVGVSTAPVVRNIVSGLVAARTLLASESGSLVTLANGAAAAFAVTLPALRAGLQYEFVTSGTLSKAVTITCPDGAKVAGAFGNQKSADGSGIATGVLFTNLIMTANVIGDSFRFVCDGTSWYVSGTTQLASTITVS